MAKKTQDVWLDVEEGEATVTVACLLCRARVAYDPSERDATITELREAGADWEVVQANLDRHLCDECRDECHTEASNSALR